MVRNIFTRSQQFLEKQQNTILSAASVIQVAILISSILGFVIKRLLISNFFTYNSGLADGAALDAYYVSFRIPDFVFQLLVVGALSAAFIPVFSKYQDKDEEEALLVANSVINIILILFISISVVTFIFAREFNQFLTGDNFTVEQLALATHFTRIMLVSQTFFAISSFMTGIIQSHQRFLIPALSPLAYNLGIIIGIVVLGPVLGLYGAAIGVVIGAFLHFAIQVPLAMKLGYRYQLLFNLKHPGVKQMFKMMFPRTLALSVDQVEMLAFTRLATFLPAGNYLIFTLAQSLINTPVRIIGVPIGQASLPFLSKENAKNNYEAFKETFNNSLLQILYLTLPASMLIIVLRIPLVRILYGAKEFPWLATLLTGKTVAVLAIAIVAYAATQLLSRAFYALHDTRVPFVSAVLSLISSITVASYLVYVQQWGLMGLAVGSVVGSFIQSGFLLIKLFIRFKGISPEKIVGPLIKMVIASSLTGVFLWVPMRLFDQILDTTRTFDLILLTIAATGIGSLVYLWLSRLLMIQQLDAYLRLLDKLGNWRKLLSSTEESIEPTETTL